MILFSQEIQVRDFIKKGKVCGLEVDFDLPYPDGLPPKRVRKKSPFVPGPKLTRERALKQSLQYGEALRQKLWGVGVRPKSRAELRAEAALPKPEPIPTLKAFAPRWIKKALVANQVSQATLDVAEEYLRLHLLPRFGDKPLDGFGVEDFQTLKVELKWLPSGKPRSANHLNAVLGLLVRILRDALRWNVTTKPVPDAEYLPVPKRQVEVYDEEQYQLLLEAAKKLSWQAHLAVLLAGDAGLRVAEIMGLRWSDVDWNKGLLHIRQQDTGREVKKPKSKISRDVPISPVLKEALLEQRAIRERVVVKTGAEKISRTTLRYLLDTAEERAGLPPKSIHKLRHTFATRYLQHKGNIRDCQALLGHTNLATTQIYLHASSKEAARIIQTLGSGER